MSLRRILVQVRQSGRILAACALIGLLLGALITVITARSVIFLLPTFRTTEYRATAEVLVSPNVALSSGSANLGDAYSAGLFTVQRAQSYVEVATVPAVLGPVADHVGATEDKVEVATKAKWVPGTSLLKVTVTWHKAKDAATIANGAAKQLAEYVDSIEQPKAGGPAVVRLTTVRAAKVPRSPQSSHLLQNLLLGLMLGLFVGLPLVLVKLLRDRRVTDGVTLAQATGELPLAQIGDHGSGVNLLLREQPSSRPAEAIRKLRNRIQFLAQNASVRSLVVAGPQPGAGASTVAANLAVALVEAGRRVVLVDGNVRHSALGRMFGLTESVGVTEVLAGEVEVAEALRGTALSGLSVLLTGRAPARPGSSLARPAMVALVERLEAQADLVIIDAPAVLPFAEAAALAAIVDGALLVVRHGNTVVDDVVQSLTALAQVHATVLGVVLNEVPLPYLNAAVGAGGPSRPTDTSELRLVGDRPSS